MTAGHNEEGDVKRSGEELGNFWEGRGELDGRAKNRVWN